MLYVGSFGFYNEEEEMSNQFFYFAEANDPDAAVEIFKKGITKAARQPDSAIYGKIYLDSFIALRKLPAGGAVAFLCSMDEHEASSVISCVNPGDIEGFDGYRWTEDGKEPGDIEDPFLIIPAPKKKRA